MKAAVHSVLFLCALCVLILGGVSIAAQNVKPVVEKATAARTAVDDAKVLGDKVKEANKDFAQSITELTNLFNETLRGITAALDHAKLITTDNPNKDEAETGINGVAAKITVTQTAVTALKNAEAELLKDPKKADIAQNLEAVEKEMKSAENAAKDMTDEDTSINGVVQKAGELKEAAEKAATLWTEVEVSVKPQKDAADVVVEEIKEAITEVDRVIAEVGKSKDSKAADVKTTLEKDVKGKLKTMFDKAEKILVASVDAHTNAQKLAGQYKALQTKADELEQAAADGKITDTLSGAQGPQVPADPLQEEEEEVPADAKNTGNQVPADPLQQEEEVPADAKNTGNQVPADPLQQEEVPADAKNTGNQVPADPLQQEEEADVLGGSGALTGASSFSAGPLLSITFPVLFLCLCVLPLQW